MFFHPYPKCGAKVSIVVHGLAHTVHSRAHKITLFNMKDLYVSILFLYSIFLGFALRAVANIATVLFLDGGRRVAPFWVWVESGQEKWTSGLNMITLYINGHHSAGVFMWNMWVLWHYHHAANHSPYFPRVWAQASTWLKEGGISSNLTICPGAILPPPCVGWVDYC